MPKPIRLLGWIVCLTGCLAAEIQAKPPPSPKQEAECLISTDFHIVHFSAFQPTAEGSKAEKFQRYCQELPRVGTAYLSVDFVDRDVRHVPIALKVVEEDKQGTALRTLNETPAQVYTQGVASVQVAFDRPGHYALLVQFQAEELADELRIPLTVGFKPMPIKWMAAGTGAAVLIGILTWIGTRYRRKVR
ncbi:MAG: hypothetical protein N3A55_07660 [Methylohalobius sp.]|nr:hypothetical protein [Methylohalobius sp.]